MKACQLAPLVFSFMLCVAATRADSEVSDEIETDLLKLLLRDLREEAGAQIEEEKRQSTCTKPYKDLERKSGSRQTMCKPKNRAAKNTVVSEEDKKKIVNFHNKIRSEVKPPAKNMQKIKWDNELAKIAQHYAATCPNWHDQNNERLHPKYGKAVWVGQNIAQGMPDWNYVLTAWYNESQFYEYGPGGSNNMMSKGKAVGHYTQQTWATTSLIGCGYADCPGVMPFEQYTDKNMFACNYVWGQSWDVTKPYEKGSKMGEDCPKHRTSKGLCDCNGLVCTKWGVEPDVSTCTCGGGKKTLKKSLLELLLKNLDD